MTLSDHENPLFGDDFIPLIVEKLGKSPIDFSEKMTSVRTSRKSKEPFSPAGVLLLLRSSEKSAQRFRLYGDFSFLLIKRSSKVAQPGDLSCPGGMLHRFIDPMLRPLITGKMFPILRGRVRELAQNRDHHTFRILSLFLTNAIRETWEETNLCPFKIVFLGPLPTYSLHLFRRIIFPLVGFVKEEWNFHPNSEVDRIVEIPLNTFFNEDYYGVYQIELSDSLDSHNPREFPCLIYRDAHGHEDILWGATFYIIMNFLQIVLGFKTPEFHSKRVIKKTLSPDYLKGRQI
jgi:8-oxo-dGTP pyrophosphatase MutT (NUDIX family)